jgi:hypothetical protein
LDSQILALLALLGIMGLGFWLMFGRPGNKKQSGDSPDNGSGGSGALD